MFAFTIFRTTPDADLPVAVARGSEYKTEADADAAALLYLDDMKADDTYSYLTYPQMKRRHEGE